MNYSGDGGAATGAELGYPWAVALDSSGNVYIGDSNNNRIRKVTASTGIISTVAGDGVSGYAGDGGIAVSAELNAPEGVAVDHSGNIYIADSGNTRIRAVGAGSAPAAPALPTFLPPAGAYLSAQTVTISDSTSGAAIYYTTNGTTPSSSSTQYTGPISVSSTETIEAIAAAGPASSAVATATYTVGTAPAFSPVSGTYTSAQVVSITSTDVGATIHYTTDGTIPTASSTQYTGPITVSATETLKAIAIVGTASSSVSTATYTINLPPPSTAVITVQGSEASGDANVITVSFNGFAETVQYGQFSTAAAVASAFGAKFSNDYLHAGLCVHANGSVITFQLKGGAPFGALDVGGSTASFHLTSSGFASQQGTTIADTGTVTLTVGGVVAAQTSYGYGAKASTVAEGLAAAVNSNSPVNVMAVDDDLYLQSKLMGAGTNYSYTVQTTSWDSADFPNPSFANPPVNGSLSGGSNAGSGQGQGSQTIYSYSIPSYAAGSQPTGYDAVGDIVGYSDSVMGNWSMSGGYDPLYRLTSASATSGAYTGLQINWGYDAFGNRTSETYGGTTNVPVPTSSTASYSANNWIASTSLGSVSYDASGDVTSDNQSQYLYDGEGRVCAVQNRVLGTMVGYVYGADGARVSEGTITTWGSCDPSLNGYQAIKDSIQGPTGGELTEAGVDGNGNVVWEHTNVWVNGELIATYDPKYRLR
ncbi:chitobiase/beta-hexosaminidase C-terminal domain-containing protein [Paracidobacterium acidisoli]|uniref:GH29D-like beta-sandwich domain-containing protein n=1 Tax=Paracidobacterium acidisoli TaxID=2303751 RepID=A0A372IIQ3_9BACT|nr:chitobiase/beta-hexosaminidase C-terminal domain-containing protein [Paracidobacterium acidisoli]MBT9333387.1 chitobiase/beta-hexosaminidase C-terminal domain-containing protein [Paracidobacterium acidisoli]